MARRGQIGTGIAALALLAGLPSSINAESVREIVAAWPRQQTPEGMLIVQSAAELAAWRREAERYRLNCPNPSGLFDEGEDASGMILRLQCSSADHRTKWSLRITFRPSGPAALTKWEK